MIKVVLLTGFLGAGKTTLLKYLLEYFTDTPVGIIVNEFGEINIDARLLEKEGIATSELSNGSIFCACIKENFIKALIDMASHEIEYLFIEASGLADPGNMDQIFEAIQGRTLHSCSFTGSICVLDGETFLELNQVLPAVQNQLIYAGAVVVNKEDLTEEAVRSEIREEVRRVNPAAPVYFTRYCRTDILQLIDQLNPSEIESRDTTNTVENRPQSYILKVLPAVSMEGFSDFLNYIAPFTFRIKGFVKIGEKNYSVSGVRSHIMIMPWAIDIPASEIVLISAVGIGLTGLIAHGIETYVPSFLALK